MFLTFILSTDRKSKLNCTFCYEQVDLCYFYWGCNSLKIQYCSQYERHALLLFTMWSRFVTCSEVTCTCTYAWPVLVEHFQHNRSVFCLCKTIVHRLEFLKIHATTSVYFALF